VLDSTDTEVVAVEPVIVDVTPPTPPPFVPFLDLPEPPTELPRSVRELVNAAFEAKNDAVRKEIINLARSTHPMAQAQIDAIEAEYEARRAEEIARAARQRAEWLAAASPLDNWRGEIELGGSRSTGNTDSVAIYGAVRMEREGLKWSHLVQGRTDFQRSDGDTTADRLSLGWQPNHKFRENLFVYGLSQYERDRFLGFTNRFTASAGVGMILISRPEARLSLQGGPAVRHTDFLEEGPKTTGAARASVAARWNVTPTLSLTQDAAFYFESTNRSASSRTALESRLIGSLKARLSYDVLYERNDDPFRDPVDTTSRATLVYGF